MSTCMVARVQPWKCATAIGMTIATTIAMTITAKATMGGTPVKTGRLPATAGDSNRTMPIIPAQKEAKRPLSMEAFTRHMLTTEEAPRAAGAAEAAPRAAGAAEAAPRAVGAAEAAPSV